MERSCGKLKPEALGKVVESQHVAGVVVADRASESDVFQPHLLERQQCAKPLVESSLAAAQMVVGLAETFDRDSDADFREPAGELDDAVFEPSRCRDDNARSVAVTFLDNFGQIGAHKRLATCQVDELEGRKRRQIRGFDLFFLASRVFPDVTHLALHRAAVGQDDRGICWFWHCHIIVNTLLNCLQNYNFFLT